MRPRRRTHLDRGDRGHRRGGRQGAGPLDVGERADVSTPRRDLEFLHRGNDLISFYANTY